MTTMIAHSAKVSAVSAYDENDFEEDQKVYYIKIKSTNPIYNSQKERIGTLGASTTTNPEVMDTNGFGEQDSVIVIPRIVTVRHANGSGEIDLRQSLIKWRKMSTSRSWPTDKSLDEYKLIPTQKFFPVKIPKANSTSKINNHNKKEIVYMDLNKIANESAYNEVLPFSPKYGEIRQPEAEKVTTEASLCSNCLGKETRGLQIDLTFLDESRQKVPPLVDDQSRIKSTQKNGRGSVGKLNPQCTKFIDDSGNLGDWGTAMLNEMNRSEYNSAFTQNNAQIAQLCRGYNRMDDQNKKKFLIRVMTTVAHIESSCNPGAVQRNAINRYNKGIGLFQMDSQRAKIAYRNSDAVKITGEKDVCSNPSDPKQNIKCSTFILYQQLRNQSNGLFYSKGYWEPLRPRSRFKKQINNTIANYPGCNQ